MKIPQLKVINLIVLAVAIISVISCSKDTDLLADYVATDFQEARLSGNLFFNDTYIVSGAETTILDVLENDVISNPDKVKIINATQPENGTVVINGDGTVTFTPTGTDGCDTSVAATLTGLPAESVVGWHVHEFGDISAADGSATGGHYNPGRVLHALPPAAVRHAGDLGNLLPASVAGVAVVRAQFSAALTTRAAVGRGLIIHALRDDGGQPTGNAGARLAQCVLGVAAPPPAPPAPPPPAAMLPVVVSPTTGGGGWYEAWLASLADFMGDRRGSA